MKRTKKQIIELNKNIKEATLRRLLTLYSIFDRNNDLFGMELVHDEINLRITGTN